MDMLGVVLVYFWYILGMSWGFVFDVLYVFDTIRVPGDRQHLFSVSIDVLQEMMRHLNGR